MSSAGNTRERLLDAAATILEEDGLTHLNTNALARRAGLTPPTVYRHFKNKEEVMESLARRFIAAEKAWLERAETGAEGTVSLDELVCVLIDLYWTSARKHRGIVALRSAMRVWPSLHRVEQESLKSSTDTLVGMLAAYGNGVPRTQLERAARCTVETACSTVDRCYALALPEQTWRIAELKIMLSRYLSAQLRCA
jgi:AcrR family transcriptional regulator